MLTKIKNKWAGNIEIWVNQTNLNANISIKAIIIDQIKYQIITISNDD